VGRIARWGASFAALMLVLPAAAMATTRYAAPGGTAAPTACQSPSGPFCSIGAAAGGTGVGAGDEAVILPGNYSDSAGDLDGDVGNPTDHVVQPTAATVHGVVGQLRPVITVNTDNFYGAFLLGSGTLSDVEISTSAATNALTTVGGTSTGVVDRVIARSSKDNGIACNQAGGTIRNSVCLSSGSGGVALGASTFIGGTFTTNVRNVTAIATGAGSNGAFYFYATASPPVGPTITVSAKSLIAQGTAQDVRVRASGTGTTVTMNLDHSDYDTAIDEDASGGAASVTAAGTGTGNITGTPLLAADGYHELTGSPTINAGATDGNSGTTDIDGQLRQIGLAAPDIGADEFAAAPATNVACAPSSVLVATSTTCTATVTAAAETVTGTVAFVSGSAGTFTPGSCTLSGGLLSKQCQVSYVPTAAGTHQITASYSGDASNDPSEGTTALAVTSPPPNPPSAKKKKCKKRKHRAAAAKKKCKKKR
jgi:hypothetical protein